MEFRELQYFLAVVQEGTISAAAKALHVTQPSLSRQIKELESKLGKSLFIRGNRRIELTQEGMILRKRAEEMLHMMQKTEREIASGDTLIQGDIYIGAAETTAMKYLMQAAGKLKKQCPDICYHIASGDTTDVMAQLEQGLIDFAVVFEPGDLERYHYLVLPQSDQWGILMREDSHLAALEKISLEDDLAGQPLIVSRLIKGQLYGDKHLSKFHIAATYNLVYNASLMVEAGLGCALCFDHIANVDSPNNHLCFRPLKESPKIYPVLLWKKNQLLSRPCNRFLEEFELFSFAKCR